MILVNNTAISSELVGYRFVAMSEARTRVTSDVKTEEKALDGETRTTPPTGVAAGSVVLLIWCKKENMCAVTRSK